MLRFINRCGPSSPWTCDGKRGLVRGFCRTCQVRSGKNAKRHACRPPTLCKAVHKGRLFQNAPKPDYEKDTSAQVRPPEASTLPRPFGAAPACVRATPRSGVAVISALGFRAFGASILHPKKALSPKLSGAWFLGVLETSDSARRRTSTETRDLGVSPKRFRAHTRRQR